MREIIKDTHSMCPECHRVLPATIFEENGSIWIEKECPEHGKYRVLYWSDADLYHRAAAEAVKGRGILNPNDKHEGCPADCGLCANHKSPTILGIVNVTTRCNLDCNICFDKSPGYSLYEPSLDEIRRMFETLRNVRPTPAPAVQITGGEPTIRNDLPEILEMARDMGFKFIFVNTNGIRFGNSKEFFKKCMDAGMTHMYLSFDGVTPEKYEFKVGERAGRLLEIKKKVVENAKELGFGNISLVPTWHEYNMDETWKIIEFARDNNEAVNCVNIQPLGFVGELRGIEKDPKEGIVKIMDKPQRLTIPDCIEAIEEQSGGRVRREHFHSVPYIHAFFRLMDPGENFIPDFTTHPHCGMGTFVLFDENGTPYALPDIIDTNRIIDDIKNNVFFKLLGVPIAFTSIMGGLGEGMKRLIPPEKKAQLARLLLERYKKEDAPEEMFEIVSGYIQASLTGGDTSKFLERVRAIFIGIMHFQGEIDLDLERIQHCQIHYPTPDGDLIPFCKGNLKRYRPDGSLTNVPGLVLDDVKKKYSRE